MQWVHPLPNEKEIAAEERGCLPAVPVGWAVRGCFF